MSTNLGQLPPPESPSDFESLCLDVLSVVYADPGTQKHGRLGQKQHGVDLLATYKGAPVGLQCKLKDRLSEFTRDPKRLRAELKRELVEEAEKASAFQGRLRTFIFATSAPTDAEVQAGAEGLRGKYPFTVEVWFWEKLLHEIVSHPDLLNRILRNYYRGLLDALQGYLEDPTQIDYPMLSRAFNAVARDVRPYLEYIAPLCQRLPLIGLDPKAKDTQLTLDAVYTSLDTRTSEPAEEIPEPRSQQAKPLSALQAVARHACLVLKGDPGSGKSTFISYLSLCLAKHHLEPDGKWIERLAGWPADARPIPLTIVLRDFVRAQPEKLPEPCADRLCEFFVKTLADARLSPCAAALETALNLGRAIVFLDGLDEVPTDAQRDFVRACALKFSERFRHSRLVLTCRTIPYQAMRLEGVPDFELAPFDDAKISQFITAWYTAHAP
ncbi:MAG: NACHT domain-containing protein, partial [Verrucomicrobia bacterium]|nr:NACHT domain-containing protein [Verrucomicrobiota bacterium]